MRDGQLMMNLIIVFFWGGGGGGGRVRWGEGVAQ